MDALGHLSLAERVAGVARDLGIQTALIGASALAAHNYVRSTMDVGLATIVDPDTELRRLEQALRDLGLHTQLNMPDDEDVLGGCCGSGKTKMRTGSRSSS